MKSEARSRSEARRPWRRGGSFHSSTSHDHRIYFTWKRLAPARHEYCCSLTRIEGGRPGTSPLLYPDMACWTRRNSMPLVKPRFIFIGTASLDLPTAYFRSPIHGQDKTRFRVNRVQRRFSIKPKARQCGPLLLQPARAKLI